MAKIDQEKDRKRIKDQRIVDKTESLACLLVIDQKSLAVYSPLKDVKVRSKGKFADIVEEFAHISNLQVNKKTEIEEFAKISNL